MSDVVLVMNMLGITGYVIGITVAFGAIALYLGFIRKA